MRWKKSAGHDGYARALYIFPHVSSLMGFIGAAGISYDRWMRFMGKLFVMQAFVSCVIMMICQMISYT
ncbi:MAG: hypothetical protein HFE83_00845 [Lachnospiraceae bacterium]|nr:hypothetical protein [Lachnospiraceae bacterium]